MDKASEEEKDDEISTHTWHTLPSFCDSCTELRAQSQQLIGEPVFVDGGRAPEEIVQLGMTRFAQTGTGRTSIQFLATNRLTERTAHGLLHFLSHIQKTAFNLCRNDELVEFNPRVLDLILSDTRTVGGGAWLRCNNLLAAHIPSAPRLEKLHGERIHAKVVHIEAELLADGALGEALKLVASVGRTPLSLLFHVDGPITPEFVDDIIEVGPEHSVFVL